MSYSNQKNMPGHAFYTIRTKTNLDSRALLRMTARERRAQLTRTKQRKHWGRERSKTYDNYLVIISN